MRYGSPRRPLLLPLLLAACAGGDAGGTDEGERWLAETDTLGDTVIVRTLAGGVWSDSVRPVAELSIGEVAGEEPYVFGRVRSLAVRPDGELLVLDAQVPVIRRYGPDGVHRGDLGREGAGPGEYRQPETVDVLPDGRIVVRDPGNNRIAVWNAQLEPEPGWRLASGLSTGRQTYVGSDGDVYVMVLLESGVPVADWR